jgi:hypothetical protein
MRGPNKTRIRRKFAATFYNFFTIYIPLRSPSDFLSVFFSWPSHFFYQVRLCRSSWSILVLREGETGPTEHPVGIYHIELSPRFS